MLYVARPSILGGNGSCELLNRTPRDRVRRPGRSNAAIVELDKIRADWEDEIDGVRDEDDGPTGDKWTREAADELCGGVGIDGGEAVVEQEDLGKVYSCQEI